MDEKVLAQYRVGEDANFKKILWLPYIVVVFGVLCAMLGFVGMDASEVAPLLVGYGIFVAVIGIVLVIVFTYISKTSITVTTKRVYGHAKWDDIDLPMDSISAVAKRTQKKNGVLMLSTSSGKISFGFYTLAKLDEVHQAVSQLISERQNNKGNVTVVNNASNADELKKYKDLLDAGIITQEEFDAKKKQLLGL